ncbi:MAG: PIN domain-containing protein, partial [bacterium]|nr:PIN domain-containing protein [bacterium]
KAYISPLIFSNLHYILRKLSNKEKALRHLRKLKLLVKIVPITERIIEFALSSEFNDFEDAILYYAAKEKGLDYLITRSKKNYKKGIITILTAEEYLELFSRNGESQ